MDISKDAIVCQLKEEEAVKVRGKFVILYYSFLTGSVRGHEGLLKSTRNIGLLVPLTIPTLLSSLSTLVLTKQSTSLADARKFKAKTSAQTHASSILSSQHIGEKPFFHQIVHHQEMQ